MYFCYDICSEIKLCECECATFNFRFTLKFFINLSASHYGLKSDKSCCET